MSWKKEFDEKFVRRFTLSEDRENTNIPNCAYSNLLGVSVDSSDIKDFIEALIKETEQRVCNDILNLQFELPYVNWIDAPVVTAKDIIKLRVKYKGVE
jgi:hypothetical protein